MFCNASPGLPTVAFGPSALTKSRSLPSNADFDSDANATGS